MPSWFGEDVVFNADKGTKVRLIRFEYANANARVQQPFRVVGNDNQQIESRSF